MYFLGIMFPLCVFVFGVFLGLGGGMGRMFFCVRSYMPSSKRLPEMRVCVCVDVGKLCICLYYTYTSD